MVIRERATATTPVNGFISADLRVHRLQPGNKELRILMEETYGIVTTKTAIAAFLHTTRLHRDYIKEHGTTPSTEVTRTWKNEIDGVARDAMESALHRAPFRTVSVGSEGDKEKEDHHGGEAAPSVQGSFGQKGKPITWKVSDVVEGTTALSQLEDGSTSALAVTEENGIMPTPEGSHYMVKLVGPKQLNLDPRISLDHPHAENLRRIIDTLGINPRQLTQVTMDPTTRPVNQEFVDAARALGVNIKLIDAGDMLPGILAGIPENNRHLILAGRGGFEEGTITAAAMRALGGFMQAREFDKDPLVYAKKPLWTLDDLVPGDAGTTVVSITGITGDNRWFYVPQILKVGQNDETHYITQTVTISETGLKKSEQVSFVNGRSPVLL